MDSLTLAAVPSGEESLRWFHHLIGRWHQLEPPLEWARAVALFPDGDSGLAGQVRQLGLVNCYQWHLEDACRLHYGQHEVMSRLKEAIDQSNQRRTAAIDTVNLSLLAVLEPSPPAPTLAPVALESPGSVYDRLSILALKRHHNQSVAVSRLLDEQIGDLCQGLDRLLADLAAGALRLKVYRIVKIYSA